MMTISATFAATNWVPINGEDESGKRASPGYEFEPFGPPWCVPLGRKPLERPADFRVFSVPIRCGRSRTKCSDNHCERQNARKRGSAPLALMTMGFQGVQDSGSERS